MKTNIEFDWIWLLQIGVFLIIIAIIWVIWKNWEKISSTFLKVSDQAYNFFKSPSGVMVSLFLLMLVFAYMYTKLYWQINPFPLNTFTDLFSSIIVGVAFSTGTLVIIVNSDNKKLALGFAFADFLASLLFFLTAVPEWDKKALLMYNQGWKFYFFMTIYVGLAVFISLMKAVLIYNYAHIFTNLSEAAITEQNLIGDLQEQVNQLTLDLSKLGEENVNLKEKIGELEQKITEKDESNRSLDAKVRHYEALIQKRKDSKGKNGKKKELTPTSVQIPNEVVDE